MRTRLFRITLFGILALVCLGGAYLVGYVRGHGAAVREDTKFGLVNYLALYKFQQHGDTNRVADWLRSMVFFDSDYYGRYFSSETVTDKYFLAHLAEARIIASQMRTQVVSVDSIINRINDEVRTNRRPNTASNPTGTAPVSSPKP